jgi:hypothetical protein
MSWNKEKLVNGAAAQANFGQEVELETLLRMRTRRIVSFNVTLVSSSLIFRAMESAG